MRKSIIFLIVLLFLVSCGHNILTDYSVAGIDLSIPIFGYPIGIRAGKIKMNTNVLRGNTSYAAQNNIGTEILTGAAQETSVIQFSANAQINEGNVEKILRDPKVPEDVKKEFTKGITQQTAPELLPVSSKTPTTATAASKDVKVHSVELPKQKSISSVFSLTSWFSDIVIRIGDFFVLTAAGKVIILLAQILAGFIVLLFIYDIIKKIVQFIKRKKSQS